MKIKREVINSTEMGVLLRKVYIIKVRGKIVRVRKE